MRRVSPKRLVVGALIAIGAPVALLIVGYVVLLFLSAPADERQYPTKRAVLQQTLDAVPKGQHLYWLGFRSNGYRFNDVSASRVSYTAETTGGPVVFISIYPGPGTRASRGLREGEVVQGRVVTPTNQLVLFTCAPPKYRYGRRCAPHATIERFKLALRPITRAQIEQLPEWWDSWVRDEPPPNESPS